MVKISGAEAMMRSLEHAGVNVLFGYPGGAIMPTFDALYDHKKTLNHILVRHEQGAVHAAQGYARVSGKVGCAIVTSGPGATNTVTGIAEGSCTITVRSDNGCEATCAVTVSKLDNVSVDDFKKKDVDTEAMLQLSDAEVLYVYEKTVYLRDTKGCIILSNTDLNVNPGH